MSSRGWQSLADLFKRVRGTSSIPEPTYGLEQLVAVKRRKTKGDERLPKSSTFLDRSEKLYRLDPLIFSGVNRLTRMITSPKIIIIGGTDEDRAKLERFIADIRLKRILREAVRDAFIYGFGIIEILEEKGNISKLRILNPKAVDFQRENDLSLKKDDNDEIVGFTVTEDGQKINIDRTKIIHIKFFGIGEDSLGITPLEPAFKVAWIRLNLEEAMGEAIFRHGYPIFYFKIGSEDKQATPDLIKEARTILKDFDSVSELILPHWIQPGSLGEKSQIADISDSLRFFAGELAHGMDIPKAYLMASERTRLTEEEAIDFSKTIQNYQDILIDILEEQLFLRWAPYRKMDEKPKLTFETLAGEEKMYRARRISMLTQRGVLTRDDKMENQIRKEEGLPSLEKTSKKEDLSCHWNLVKECPVRKLGKDPIDSQQCHICPIKKAKEVH